MASALRERRQDWIVLTKDEWIRKNPLERIAYSSAGVRVFALTTANLPSAEQAQAFIRGLPRIIRIARQTGPFIARVTRTGNVKIIERPKPGRRKKRRMKM